MTEVVVDRLKLALASRYAIERQIGQGGMATVYLARDLRHDRRVALKVLRPELAAVIGADRFLHEIRVTASLQHPHILPLHDSGEVPAGHLGPDRRQGEGPSFVYYVMPYVEGESLRDRLRRERQLPIDDTVRVASEVAAALAYAHGRGVIHRDIKPENILLASGSAVVADFGIARAVTEAGEGRLTETGLSLGTPQYMSPEQATAERELDARTDIYALAAVVYEMLVGEPPFTGPTTQSVIARLLTESPRPVRVSRPTVPDHIDAAVQKALAKLPADRFRSALAFTEALERPGVARSAGSEATPTAPRAASRAQLLAGGAVTLAAIAFGISGWLRKPAVSEALVRSSIRLPATAHAESRQSGAPLALSPDGTVLVYASTRQLFIRRLDQFDVIPIPNTLGAEQPFFSPDGRNIGFVADGSLKRVPIAGGPVVTICSARRIQGATWGPGDVVVFAAASGNIDGPGSGLYAVSANGGTPRPVLADSSAETLFRWPDFLPDGQHLLASSGIALDYRTVVVNLKTGKVELVPEAGSNARYVEPGWLLSVALGGTITALPFDAVAGRVTGDPIPVLEGVATGTGGAAKFAVSRNGWVVYAEGAPGERRLTLVDRRGAQTPIPVQAQPFNDPRFSPTGTDVVVTVLRAGRGALLGDVWTVNLQRATMSRLTFEGTDQFPDWSADGRRVVYTTLRPNNGVNWKPISGGPPDSLLKLPGRTIFDAMLTHDERQVVFRLGGIPGDLHYVSRDSLGRPHVLIDSRFDERAPAVSPDDHWLAYVSDETGQDEVYVRPFPDAGGRWVISAAGGGEPRWSRDGKELFYRNADTLFAVQIETRPTFSIGPRTALFVGSYLRNPRHATYDVHPDGQHFIFITGDTDDSGELMLVQNAMVAATRARSPQRER